MQKQIIFLFSSFFLPLAILMAQDTIYVPQDYPTIQQGIDAAVDKNVVLVDTGTYVENINFKGKGITLASKFIHNHDEFYRDHTIIDGSNPIDPDSASVVRFMSFEDSTSVLYGFTITGGLGTRGVSSDINGGGIYIRIASPKILYNRITNNDIYNDDPTVQGVFGAGIEVDFLPEDQPVLIAHNIIEDNDIEVSQEAVIGGGGIGVYSGSTSKIIIHNNVIRNNDCYSSSDNSYVYGGGIYLESVNASLDGNTIRNNSCASEGDIWTIGGGVCFDGYTYSSSLKLGMTNNIIDSNSIDGYYAYGAGVRARIGILEIENNVFKDNVIAESPQWNYGAGLCVFPIGNPGFIRNNDFINNSNNFGDGGALYLRCTDIYQEILVDGNLFMGNSAEYGGAAITYECGVEFINNVFQDNHAFLHGGAIALRGNNNNPVAHPNRIINNTFYDNDAEYTGGALYSSYGDPMILNSIFYADTATAGPEINFQAGSPEIAFTDIDLNLVNGDFTAGPGIINEDPMFCESEHECMIDPGSPCLDMGILEYTCTHGDNFLAPDHDKLGVSRPQSGAMELGAYELMFENVEESAVSSQQPAVRVWPNPTSGVSSFGFRVSPAQTTSIVQSGRGSGNVTLKLYDMHSREVATVVDREFPKGEHVVSFDAGPLQEGVYVWRLLAAGNRQLAVGKLIKF